MNPPPGVRDAATRPVHELLRGPTPTCAPEDSAAVAARVMTANRTRQVLVGSAGRLVGILTEGDLRRRIVAAQADSGTPIAVVMSSPAHTIDADTLGADALLTMLTLGVRRLVVVTPGGGALGVVEDTDLLANATRGGFLLRADIARAPDTDALTSAAARIPHLAVDLSRGRIAILDASAVIAAVLDATLTRAIELTKHAGETPAVDWLALGSIARRECVPSSDVDSALTCAQARDLDTAVAHARRAESVLAACGLDIDDKGATARHPRFARTIDDWHRAIDDWISDPWSDQALVMLTMLLDSRVVHGDPSGDLAAHTADALRGRPEVLDLLLREATQDAARVPRRGFLSRRDEPVDLKAHGLGPIVNIARWAGTASGLSSASTPARLRTAGLVLSEDQARILAEAFDALTQIRFRAQCEQIERGEAPTDVVDPNSLSPLQRSLLAGAIREVAGVQRTLAYTGR